jgi:hypothetical protein
MMCGNVLSQSKKLSRLHGEVSAWNECFAVCANNAATHVQEVSLVVIAVARCCISRMP